MMALSVRCGMVVHQFDIVTAYLNGFFDEKVYMERPEMLEEILRKIVSRDGHSSDIGAKAARMLRSLKGGDKVCLLKRALYGLRRAGRQWHACLDTYIRKLGLTPTNADPCLYYAKRGEISLLVLVYVDDILFSSQDEKWIADIGQGLAREFEVKDLGRARYCLEIEIIQEKGAVSLSQRKYVMEVLERFHMEAANPVATPGEVRARFTDAEVTADGKGESGKPYRELVDSLMYLAVATRPDIAYIASFLAQFNHCHTEVHWKAAKRVLRYLKGTADHGLCFRKSTDGVRGYWDADWANCTIHRKSYTGYAFILSGAAVSWKAQKQHTVALSSTEAEYMALAEAAKESSYLRIMLQELRLCGLDCVTVCCDNRGAKCLAENPVFHGRMKHMDVRHHFVRQAVTDGIVSIESVSTNEMPADVLTKSLPKPKHLKCIESLGVRETR